MDIPLGEGREMITVESKAGNRGGKPMTFTGKNSLEILADIHRKLQCRYPDSHTVEHEGSRKF